MMYFFRLKSLLLPVLLIGIVMLASGCQNQEGNKPAGSQPTQEVRRDIPLTNENAYETVLRELQEDPNNILALYHLGDLYFRDGKYDKAVENFQKVVAADPSRGYVFFQMGTALSRIGRLEEALDAFAKAIPQLKHPEVAYNNMGIAYGRLGRYQDEIAAMKKAIELRPRYASARYNLGVTQIKVGDLEGAREQYEALNKFDLTIAKALLKEIEKAAPAGSTR
jgi:tetratricopeptide (TPR) repeat protein